MSIIFRLLQKDLGSSSFQGSNTLPRAGYKKTLSEDHQTGSVDDSEIVITKKLTGAGSSVRIRIGGSVRSPTENIESASDNWVEPGEAAGDITGSRPGNKSQKSSNKQRFSAATGNNYSLLQFQSSYPV